MYKKRFIIAGFFLALGRRCFMLRKIMFLVFSFLVTLGLQASEITKTFTFEEENLSFGKYKDYVVPHLEVFSLSKAGKPTLLGRVSFLSKVGKPILPSYSSYILLPPGATAEEVEVVSCIKEKVAGKHFVCPAQPPRPLSLQEEMEFIPPDPLIYESSLPYPGKLVELVSTGSKAGYRIAGIFVYPLQYNPAQKELEFYSSITVRIRYKENKEKASLTPRQKEVVEREVESLVDNPEDISRFSPLIKFAGGTLEYAIITRSTYKDKFAPLVEWKNKSGIQTRVITTNYIYGNYAGDDNEEKIRNFIKEAFSDSGLIWVLIGGDDDVVPARKSDPGYSYGGEKPYADLYYSDLDGTWDGNNNLYYGEPSDNIDMYADVFVGRAPASSSSEFTTFVNKILTYEKNPSSGYLTKALLVGGLLFSGQDYWGKKIGKEIASVTPGNFSDIELYQRDGDLSHSAVTSNNNAGVGLGEYAAHGNPSTIASEDSIIIMYKSDASSYSNTNKYGIHNTIACYAGQFEGSTDCLLEALVTNPNGGALASMGNSRYGLGLPPGLGPTEKMILEFYKRLFQGGIYHLAETFGASRDVYVNDAKSEAYFRYCLYELNLFGPSSTPIWTAEPEILSVASDPIVLLGTSDFTVTVTKAGSGTPINNAYVCCSMDSTVYARGYTNSSGEVTLAISPIHMDDTMWVTTTARNYLPDEGYALVVSPISLSLISPNDGEQWVCGSTHPITWSVDNTEFDSYSLLYSLGLFEGWDTTAHSVSSPHPYPHSYDEIWTISKTGADSMKVHFDTLKLGMFADHIQILDKYDNQIINYPAGTNNGDFWSPVVPEDVVKIRLTSTFSGYGFDIDSYAAFLTEERYNNTIAIDISPDSTKWNWTLPTISCSTAKVKIQAIAGEIILSKDESDAYFSITEVTDITPPTPFSLILPEDSTILGTSRPTFIWFASSDAESGLHDYKVYIDGAVKYTGTDTSWLANYDLPEDYHSWYIVASDNAGNPRQSNETWTVLIDTTPPSVPALVSPANNDTLSNTLVAFEWGAVTKGSPVNYILQVDTTNSFGSPVIIDTTELTTRTFTLTYDEYWWKVRAYDLAGNESGFSDIWSFEIEIGGHEDTAIVSIPYDTVDVGSDSNTVYINLENPLTVAGVQIVIEYDTLLTAHEAGKTSRSSMMSVSSSIGEDSIQILLSPGSTSDTITSGTGYIIEIPFDVPSNAMPGDSTLLHIKKVVLSDTGVDPGELPSYSVDGWLYFAPEDTTLPQVTVVSPDSGEVWVSGTTDTIKWTATDANGIDSVSIYLSLNGGGSYPYTIAQGIPNTSPYPYTVMDTFSTECKMKVVAWDLSGNSAEDESNYDFVIAYGEKGDVKPNGEINILDITRVVNIIQAYGDSPTSYELWAADIKEDGEINILDIVVIVHRIQGKDIGQIADVGNTAIVSISRASGIIGTDDNIVYVNLKNQIGVTGIQIRIGYDPLLLTPREARTTSSSDILDISSTIDTNYIQMLLYSTSLDTIASDNRTIIEIPFYISPGARVSDSTLLHIEYLLLSDVSAQLIPSQSVDGFLHFGTQDTDGKVIPLPKVYGLSQAYPSPGIREITIPYQLPEPTRTSLNIYDITGKLIHTVIHTKQAPGYHSIVWDAKDTPNGIYFYKLETPSFTQSKKLIILR